MKKFLAAAVVTGLIGGSAFAATNVVSSANVVGYVKVQVPANGLAIVANQFINSSQANMTIDEMFGTSMPDSTILYIFNGTYGTYLYSEGDGWLDGDFAPAGNVVIARGQSFWIQNPTADLLSVTLAGDVPGNAFQSSTNALPEGLSMVSSSYPTEVTLNTLGVTPADGDLIYVYNNGYTTYLYSEGDGWLDGDFSPAGDVKIDVGVGFWYKSGASNTWIQNKPYANF